MLIEHISAEMTLFFILYGVTGMVALLAAVYLLLRKGNAFAPGVTPPLRLRRWATAFFAASVLGHVWWYLLYNFSCEAYSVAYMAVVVIDYLGMLTTITGTMFSMLQDYKRPIWPAFVAMIPFSVLVVLQSLYHDETFLYVCIAYNLALFVLFFVYMLFAVRRYERWLNENYADLENKKVWLSQLLSLIFVFLFVLYELVDTYFTLIYLLHIVELVFFALLLWRVETLPQLDSISREDASGTPSNTAVQESDDPIQELVIPTTIDLAKIERLLAERCVATQLYLQHDLNLKQMAQAIGTNRSYLSQYFSRQGITYNIYINNLRINHFINRYQEAIRNLEPFTVQQLASESGYHSYSTFSLAFKQRTGRSVTAWMRQSGRSLSK